MTFKGVFKQKYTLDRVLNELVVEVQLHEREGMIKPYQNLCFGTGTIDGKEINPNVLLTCVNAKLSAEKIGKETINAWKIQANLEGKTFRLKRK